jgi:hypothetical protein
MYAVFATQALALAAAAAIWALLAPSTQDILAATGRPVSPQITNSWSAPYARLTDGLWVVPISQAVTVSGQSLWTIQPFSRSWVP